MKKQLRQDTGDKDDFVMLTDASQIKNELIKNKKYKFLCKAFWNAIQQDVESVIRPCCVYGDRSIEIDKYTNLTDAFYGIEFNELRNKSLSGEKIAGCSGCYNTENDGEWSLRNHYNQHFDDDTIKLPKIRSLEVGLDNKCNFKCVICSSKFSTAWFEDEKMLQKITNLKRQNSRSISNNTRYIKNEFDLEKINTNDLLLIRITGGEPFMNTRLHDWLSSIDLSHIELTIISNNSIFPRKWIDTIKRAKKFRLIISCDGIGDVGEFSRYGMKHDIFTKNLHKWKSVQNNRIIVSFNYVVHNLNVLNVEKTFKYIKENGFDDDQYEWYNKLLNAPNWKFNVMSIDRLHFPEYLDIRYLPIQTKNMIKDEYDKMTSLSADMKNKILNWMFSHDTDIVQCEQFIKYTNFLENRTILPKECEIIYDSVIKNI